MVLTRFKNVSTSCATVFAARPLIRQNVGYLLCFLLFVIIPDDGDLRLIPSNYHDVPAAIHNHKKYFKKGEKFHQICSC